ncbi:hypothetical protein Tco_1105909 [Tanacetum coccineum]
MILEKQLTNEILHEIDCKTALTKLKTMFENTLHSKLRECLQNYTTLETYSIKYTIIGEMDFIKKYMLETILHQHEIQKLLTDKKLLYTQEVQINIIQALNVDSVIMENTCSRKENYNSETAFSKSVKESSLDSRIKDVHVLSKEDLKGTRIEHGFKRAFLSLFGQDDETFTSTMFFNVDQLQKQLDKDEFQEDESMVAFLGNVKKSIAERTRHQRQYDRRVNKRQMQTQESKVDLGNAMGQNLESRIQATR